MLSRGISAHLIIFNFLIVSFKNKLQEKHVSSIEHTEQLTSPTKSEQEMCLDMKSLSIQSKNTTCLLREYQNAKDIFRKVKDIKVLQQVLAHEASSMSVQENWKWLWSELKS